VELVVSENYCLFSLLLSSLNSGELHFIELTVYQFIFYLKDGTRFLSFLLSRIVKLLIFLPFNKFNCYILEMLADKS